MKQAFYHNAIIVFITAYGLFAPLRSYAMRPEDYENRFAIENETHNIHKTLRDHVKEDSPDASIIESLFRNNADPNHFIAIQAYANGIAYTTPFHALLEKSAPNIEHIHLFLNNKADCNKKKQVGKRGGFFCNHSPFEEAIMNVADHKLTILEMLINANAQIDTTSKKASSNELHYLMWSDKKERKYDKKELCKMIQFFLDRGNDINRKNAWGQTPLSSFLIRPYQKLEEGDLTVLKMLLDSKADPNKILAREEKIKPPKPNTITISCVMPIATPFVELLLQDCSPIVESAIKLLLEYKANPFLIDTKDKPIIANFLLQGSFSLKKIDFLLKENLLNVYDIFSEALTDDLENFCSEKDAKEIRNKLAYCIVDKVKEDTMKLYKPRIFTLLLCLKSLRKIHKHLRVPKVVFTQCIINNNLYALINNALGKIEKIKHKEIWDLQKLSYFAALVKPFIE